MNEIVKKIRDNKGISPRVFFSTVIVLLLIIIYFAYNTAELERELQEQKNIEHVCPAPDVIEKKIYECEPEIVEVPMNKTKIWVVDRMYRYTDTSVTGICEAFGYDEEYSVVRVTDEDPAHIELRFEVHCVEWLTYDGEGYWDDMEAVFYIPIRRYDDMEQSYLDQLGELCRHMNPRHSASGCALDKWGNCEETEHG